MALVIDAPTKEKVAFLASKHRRSTSAEIVVAIEAWVKQHADDMAGFEPSEPDSEA